MFPFSPPKMEDPPHVTNWGGPARIRTVLPRYRHIIAQYLTPDDEVVEVTILWMLARHWRRCELADSGNWSVMAVGPFVVCVRLFF